MKFRVVTPFLAALLMAAVCVSVFAVPRSQIQDVYKWKPEHIYSTVQKWEEDVQALRTGLDALAAFKGQFSGPSAKNPAESLIAYNQLSEQLKIKYELLEAYCSYHFHVDMGDAEWVGRSQQMEDLSRIFNEKTSWFEPELLTIPRATLMHWVDANPALQTYRKTYEDMFLLQEHTLSEPEEQILAQAGNITETAADVFGKMTNVDMRWGYLLDEKGDSVQITDEGWTSWRVSQ
ncbi:hypothetical protein EHM69_00220, partial [candidate division KSB1 bacterium]